MTVRQYIRQSGDVFGTERSLLTKVQSSFTVSSSFRNLRIGPK